MRNLLPALAGIAAIASAAPAFAATLLPIVPVPGASQTLVSAINDKNVIAGTYVDQDGIKHGYAGTLDGDYATFDFGNGANNTVPLGIDTKGDVTGTSFASSDAICDSTPFERSKGKVNAIKKGSQDMTGLAWGMDSKGDFVGYYCDVTGFVFGYQGKAGKYKKAVTISGTQLVTAPSGINASGLIVGWSADITGAVKGFVLKGGTTSFVTYPKATDTQLIGINDKGQATGEWTDSKGVQHAFLYDTKKSKFTSLEPKDATTSVAGGINNDGLIALYADTGAFIYCPKKCPKAGRAIADGESLHVNAGKFLTYDNTVGRKRDVKLPRIPFVTR